MALLGNMPHRKDTSLMKMPPKNLTKYFLTKRNLSCRDSFFN